MRNYGDKVEIDPEAVRKFYDQRFDPARPLGSVMLSDDEEMLRKRDENEKRRVMDLFRLDPGATRLLDLGCGNGRWYEAFRERVWAYEGVDFSEPNVRFARENRRGPRVNFEIGASDRLGELPLKYAPYHFVLSCGLFVYLNDDQVEATFRALVPRLQPAAQLYVRTSVSVMGQRLTLKDFPSEALRADYHGIYRTPEEYEAYFRAIFLPAGFGVASTQLLLNEEIGAKKETNQQYWLLERRGA
ncbi:MAG: methyltransferase domain-containing protein [Verrucomicrobia bacterium]|nr:methyltransferase domain-containing protein [Verrucomicrobiota bacterium]